VGGKALASNEPMGRLAGVRALVRCLLRQRVASLRTARTSPRRPVTRRTWPGL